MIVTSGTGSPSNTLLAARTYHHRVALGGAVTALRVDDGRFRAHELLTAFDADGDGVDDLAARGTTQRAGGTALLRLDLNRRRAERLVAGFAWEMF